MKNYYKEYIDFIEGQKKLNSQFYDEDNLYDNEWIMLFFIYKWECEKETK